MSKGGGRKKSTTRVGRNTNSHLTTKSDFTIYDFAHCDTAGLAVKSSRTKKGDASAWSVEAKGLCGKSIPEDISLAWYDKELSDIESEIVDSSNLKDNWSDEDVENEVITNVGRCPTAQRVLNEGQVYPLDVWFLLSEYICPEDVATFAAICPYSHFVVHSAKFWYSLYKRFFNSNAELPESLKPRSMERVHGLKSRVIRSLFYMYPSFQNGVCCTIPFKADPDCLEGTKCILMWFQRVKQMWHFFFKFERSSKSVCALTSTNSKSVRDSLMADANVSHNPEERCIILQVVSSNFIALPMIVGQVLIKSFISVGHGMRNHRLKLVFNPNYIHVTRATLGNGTTVVLDPVLNIHILRWWDPKYPGN